MDKFLTASSSAMDNSSQSNAESGDEILTESEILESEEYDSHSENETELNEVTELNEHQKILNAKDDLNFKSKTVEEKWAIILTNNNLVKLRTLVAKLLSIYSSNAYVESVFSIVNGIWSDERNRFKPKTVNAIASVKCNSDLTCAQAYDLFLSDNDLLDKAKSSEKYN
jgi:hypothetical protein